MVPPLTLCAYMKKGPNLRWSLIQCSGGDEGDRTPDLLTASQALSQLSYAPVTRRYYRGRFLVVQEVFCNCFTHLRVSLLAHRPDKTLMQQIRYCSTGVDLNHCGGSDYVANAGVG